MNLNYYKTQTLLKAVVQMPVTCTFLKDTFFPTTETFVTEDVLLDFQKGKRKMAPFVAPKVGGITLDRQGYETRRYTAPKIAPQRIITLDDIVIRGIGENVFSNRTPEQRQAELLAKDLQDLEGSIGRREEWLVRQILFEGKAVMKGYIDKIDKDFVEQELDYKFTNRITLEGTSRWGQSAASIYDNLEAWRAEVIEKTDTAPDIAVFGRDALAAFRSDPKIQLLFNNLNMNFGAINPTVQANGLTFVGKLTGLGLEIYTYDATYLDENNTVQPFIPKDSILLAKKNLGTMLYGAVTQMEQGVFKTYEGNLIPKSWSEEENDQRMIRLTSRPVPKPNDVDDWFVAKVV